jgi:succinate dehydrogenase/fumarate reductase flavoprotein subunit
LKTPEAERQLRTCTETINLLDVGYLILKSAVFRTESRGGHYRTDYPLPSQNWQAHILVQGEEWQISPLSKPGDSQIKTTTSDNDGTNEKFSEATSENSTSSNFVKEEL